MLRDKLKNSHSLLFWIGLTTCLVLLYFPLLITDPLLNRDDTLLVLPLLKIHSISAYLHFFGSPWNYDLQPVRDLSYFLDILSLRVFVVKTFHAQNLVLWLSCCLVFYRILRKLGMENFVARLCTALFALHPAYSGSIGWVAARKHLLAFFFLLLFFNQFLRLKERVSLSSIFLLILFFAFSLFSQPIYVLLPLWIAIFLATEFSTESWIRENIGSLISFLGLLFLLAAMVSYANIAHYSYIYEVTQDKIEKINALKLTQFTPIGDSLLALGRYFYQLVIPWSYSTSYARSSIKNLIGLFFLPLAFLVFKRKSGLKLSTQYVALFVCLLGIVLTKIQVLFISDSYLLGASLGLWILLGFSIQASLNAKNRRLILFSVVLCLLLFGARSYASMRAWRSDYSLWANAYAIEPDCYTSQNHATNLFASGEIGAAMEVSHFHLQNKCNETNSRVIYFLAVFYESRFTAAEKISILNQHQGTDANKDIVLAALYLRENNPISASEKLSALSRVMPKEPTPLQIAVLEPLRQALSDYCEKVASFNYCKLLK